MKFEIFKSDFQGQSCHRKFLIRPRRHQITIYGESTEALPMLKMWLFNDAQQTFLQLFAPHLAAKVSNLIPFIFNIVYSIEVQASTVKLSFRGPLNLSLEAPTINIKSESLLI